MTRVQNTERSVAGECVKCDGPFRSGQVPRAERPGGTDGAHAGCGVPGRAPQAVWQVRDAEGPRRLLQEPVPFGRPAELLQGVPEPEVATSNERRRTRPPTNGPQVPRPAPVLGAQAKQCRICNITKAPVAFRPNNNSGDGLATACRECQDSTATPAPPANNATL